MSSRAQSGMALVELMGVLILSGAILATGMGMAGWLQRSSRSSEARADELRGVRRAFALIERDLRGCTRLAAESNRTTIRAGGRAVCWSHVGSEVRRDGVPVVRSVAAWHVGRSGRLARIRVELDGGRRFRTTVLLRGVAER